MSALKRLWCVLTHGFYIDTMSGDWMRVGCSKCGDKWWMPR